METTLDYARHLMAGHGFMFMSALTGRETCMDLTIFCFQHNDTGKPALISYSGLECLQNTGQQMRNLIEHRAALAIKGSN